LLRALYRLLILHVLVGTSKKVAPPAAGKRNFCVSATCGDCTHEGLRSFNLSSIKGRLDEWQVA
jgi:hypothetical protein